MIEQLEFNFKYNKDMYVKDVSSNIEVLQISNKETDIWLLKKHYAARKCSRSYSFGLFVGGVIEGVVTYGSPPSPPLCVGICGKEHKKQVLELNRLCINSNTPKNSASMLVGRSLKKLPKGVVVSYADTSVGHVGYIYQATNWLYTGLSAKRKEWREVGKNTHSKSVCEKYTLEERINDNRFALINRPQKHRYVFFTDKKLRKYLNYKIFPYPKGETKRYICPDIKNGELLNVDKNNVK